MKKLILMIAFGFISNGVFAQAPLKEGGVQLNAGLGASDWGVPVYVGLDFGLVRDVTLGGQLSYQNYRRDYYGDSRHYNNSAIGISLNGNYHFNRILDIPSKFDFYAGANLTYYIYNDDRDDDIYDDYYDDYSSFGPGLQVGGRYFFTKNFGLNLELGGNTEIRGAKFGITYIF